MPRRRVQTGEPRSRRTRTGCQTCRKRKIKCDEAKPTCSQCTLKGLSCDTVTSLKWETDYHSRGLAFGRAANPQARRASDLQKWLSVSTIRPYSFLNSTVGLDQELTTLEYDSSWDLVYSDDCTKDKYSEVSSVGSSSPWLQEAQFVPPAGPIQFPLSAIPQMHSSTESILLSYFFERVLPLTVPQSAAIPPLASVIFPYSVSQSQAVFQSLIALAACHRSRSDKSYRATALAMSEKAVRRLRFRLATEPLGEVAMDPETLVVMMILCLFEIVSQSENGWVIHLKGARDLIRLRRRLRAITDVQDKCEPVAYAERFFAFQDVIGRTACGETPIFGRDFWSTDSTQCDPWLGCSPQLVGILCSITELSSRHSIDPSIEMSFEYQSQAASLERQLEHLQQDTASSEDYLLSQCAELKKRCAELYLHCSLHGATPAMPLVKDRVCNVLDITSKLLQAGVAAGLTWPIFIAAVELCPWDESILLSNDGFEEYSRAFILRALDQLSDSMSNVRRTRSVIEKVWAAREAHDLELVDTSCIDPRNDWERFVAPFCGQMSLA